MQMEIDEIKLCRPLSVIPFIIYPILMSFMSNENIDNQHPKSRTFHPKLMLILQADERNLSRNLRKLSLPIRFILPNSKSKSSCSVKPTKKEPCENRTVLCETLVKYGQSLQFRCGRPSADRPQRNRSGLADSR